MLISEFLECVGSSFLDLSMTSCTLSSHHYSMSRPTELTASEGSDKEATWNHDGAETERIASETVQGGHCGTEADILG